MKKFALLFVILLIGLIVFPNNINKAQVVTGLDYPFPSGEEWQIINGYHDGQAHGSIVGAYDHFYAFYAFDFIRVGATTAGSPVFAPTDFYYYRENGGTNDNKCADFALGSATEGYQLFMELCHIDFVSQFLTNGLVNHIFVPKGSYLGDVASSCANCSPPHIHMAVHMSPADNPWEPYANLGFDRFPQAYIQYASFDLRLNGDSYPDEDPDNPDIMSRPMNQHEPTYGLYSNQPNRNDPSVSGIDEPPSGGGSSGDSDVDLWEHAYYSGIQYGGACGLGVTNMPNYLESMTSSVDVFSGCSVMLYDGFDGTGSRRCFNTNIDDMQHVVFTDGINANDKVSSFQTYTNNNCSGQFFWGVAPGDTVTIHNDPEYSGGIWGVHAEGIFNVPAGMNISSIGRIDTWSLLVYTQQNGQGTAACIWWTDPNLNDNYYHTGELINDNFQSFQVFHNNDCSGWTASPPTGNLVQNPSFEQLTSGWANNWSRDDQNFVVVDTGSQGSEGTNSLHLLPNTTGVRAWSDLMTVVYSNSYTWSFYVKTTTGTGELVFLVDEFDSSYNYVNTVWVGNRFGDANEWLGYTYNPSASNVAYASIQYFHTDNTGFNSLLDSVSFEQN